MAVPDNFPEKVASQFISSTPNGRRKLEKIVQQNDQRHSPEATIDSCNLKRNSKRALFEYPPLPEIKLCFVITIGAILYGWYCVYQVSQRYQFKIGQPALINVLPLFGARFKDQSNWEWSRWSPFALTYLPFLLAHSVLFNVGEIVLPRRLWMGLSIALSVVTSAYLFTSKLLLCSLLQGALVFLSTLYFRRTISVWLSALPILYIVMNHSFLLSEDVFLVLLFVSYTLLSYISFCLEWVKSSGCKKLGDSRETKPASEMAFRMLFYTFYQPYLFSLIVLYPEFEKQMEERKTRRMDWKRVVFFAVRISFWWLFVEFLLHFFYFEIILNDSRFAAALPKNEFVTLGMAMGAFFHLKYVVIFGLPAAFARIDNMQPPDGPICISRIGLYSKIWRGFDRGLYAFFKEYIFVPICAPSFSIGRKVFGVLVSYTFVLLWHGFLHQNIIWIVLNIVELFVEFGGKAVYTIPGAKEWREGNVSDTNFRRFLAILQILPFAFGLYSNFYFLGGSEVGWMFVERIFLEETVTLRWPFFLLIFIGYFYMHVGMEVERWEKSDKKICPVGLSKDGKENNKEYKNKTD